MLADFMALKKALMLCGPCEARLPQRWMARYGYRLLRNMHTSGRCDLRGRECVGYGACNIYHHEEGGYVAEWDRLRTIEKAIEAQ